MSVEAIYTDPSEELARVAEWLQTVGNTGRPHEAFAQAMSLESGSAAFYDALSAITTRAANFRDLVDSLAKASPKMTPLMRAELSASSAQILQFLAPSALSAQWAEAHREAAKKAQSWFEAGSPLVGMFVRLKVFPESQRIELLEQLRQAQSELLHVTVNLDWQDIALSHGIGRLIVMLEAFPFFGYAAVEAQSAAVMMATRNSALRAQSDGNERLKILKTVAATVAVVLSFVGAVNTADSTMTSAGHLLQWFHGEDPYEFGNHFKALPGPAQ